jgi:hypothetical protein
VPSGQVSRTNETGIVCQLGNAKLWLGSKPSGRHVSQKSVSNGCQQMRTRNGNASPNDKNLRVENRVQTGARLSEPVAQHAEGREGPGIEVLEEGAKICGVNGAVALAHGGETSPHNGILRGLRGKPEKRTARAILLNAPARSAAALAPIRNYSDVAQFGSHAEATAEETAIANNRAAHSRANSEHGHV